MKVALQPASLKTKSVLLHYQDTIDRPVDLRKYRNSMNSEFDTLMDLHPSGNVALWGVTPGKGNINVSKYNKLSAGDYVFFYGEKRLYLGGYITHTFHNPELAKQLWTVDRRGQTWEHMYSLGSLRTFSVPIEEVRECLRVSSGFYVMNLYVAEGDNAERLIELCNLTEPPSQRARQRRRVRPKAATRPDPPKSTGDSDRQVEVRYRTEQRRLRDWLLSITDAECALCGRHLPDEFLVAAHIKKRARCTEEERHDLSNVAMLACALGCDKLFEEGYVGVGAQGQILVSPEVEHTPHLQVYVKEHLVGRQVSWHTETRAGYFAWHRTRTFVAGLVPLDQKPVLDSMAR